jgi:hypothetical protein
MFGCGCREAEYLHGVASTDGFPFLPAADDFLKLFMQDGMAE